MSIDETEASPQPAPIDFRKVVQRFAPSETAANEQYQAKIVKGIQEANTSLVKSTGELIVAQYHNNESFVLGAAKTNGKGINVSKNPDTNGAQIEFGVDAVIMEERPSNTVSYQLNRREALVIPEGFPLDLFASINRERDLMIGDHEIKQKLRFSGATQIGQIGFILEQAGVNTDTFLNEYCYVSERSSDNERKRVWAQIRNAIHTFRQTYGIASEASPMNEVDRTVHVQPITIEEGEIVIGNRESNISIADIIDPSVISEQEMMDAIRKANSNEETLFYLSWTGSDVPRGALINGVEIAYTEGGKIVNTAGEKIGTYMRPKPARGDEREMIAFIKKETE